MRSFHLLLQLAVQQDGVRVITAKCSEVNVVVVPTAQVCVFSVCVCVEVCVCVCLIRQSFENPTQ